MPYRVKDKMTTLVNKIKLLWGHNPLNWLRFQWQLKSVQNGNNIIIVVAVVAVVVVRLFLFNCCGNYFSNIMDHKIFWSKNGFYPKKILAQKRCWYNKMLGKKKLRFKKSFGPQNFDYKKILPKKFRKNQVSNSWDNPDMDKCHQNSFGLKKCCVQKIWVKQNFGPKN